MEKVLQIKRDTFTKLNNYCTPELIETLFDDLGIENVFIDETNSCDDIWDVTSIIKQDSNLLEKAKLSVCLTDFQGKLFIMVEEHIIRTSVDY